VAIVEESAAAVTLTLKTNFVIRENIVLLLLGDAGGVLFVINNDLA
jgi:hypothetical protein